MTEATYLLSSVHEQSKGRWFREGTVPGRRHGNVDHGFRLTDLAHAGRTEYQDVLIFDNPVYGRVLVLDGIVQLSTADERVYHEMLVHPVMLSHPAPKRVLIVGGGDGGALREVLTHNPDEVVMIDLDRELVELAARLLPTLSNGAFDDPRVQLLHEDAAVWLQQWKNAFDVAVIDCNDAIGPSVPLFEAPFYQDVARALRPGGVCAVQGGSFLDIDFLRTTRDKIATSLPHVTALRLTVPSYHCGEYCFFLAAADQDPSGPPVEELERRVRSRGLSGRFTAYTPALHHASQVLPPRLTLTA